MARRFRTVQRGGRSVRETIWFGFNESRSTLASANTAVLVHTLNAAALSLRPFTIVRSLFHWSVRSDQTGASENYSAGFGIAVVTDQASAIGVTAVPTPFTDLGSDEWLLHDVIDGRFEFISGTGVEANSLSPRGGKLIESKAMRKVENGSDIVTVVENDSIGFGTVVYLVGRMLVKLH